MSGQRYCWCNLSSVASRSNALTSCAPVIAAGFIAPMSSAARDTLNTASWNGTSGGSAARALLVDSSKSGMNTDAVMRSSTM